MTDLEQRRALWRLISKLEHQRKGVKVLDQREGGALEPGFNSPHVHLFGGHNDRQTQNQDQPEGSHA